MSRAARYASLSLYYLSQCLKGRLAYRADVWAGFLSDLAYQAANLVFILVVFEHVPAVRGWTRDELIFIYGYFLVPFALFMATAANLWDFADRYIVRGEMDRILTRPLPSLFQVLMETLDPDSLLGAFTGVLVMVWAGGRLSLNLHWWDVPLAAALILGSTLIYHGIFIVLASVAFWTDSRTGLVPLVWNLNPYGRYPVEIYDRWLGFLLTWVLPLAFTAFIPATYLLNRDTWRGLALATPLMGAAFFALGLAAWNAGLRRYRGAGW